MSQRTTKPTIRFVRSAKTQICLRIRAVWSESALTACAFYSLQTIQRGMNKKPCHTGWMYRLILVFAGHTGLIMGFVVHWLIYVANVGNMDPFWHCDHLAWEEGACCFTFPWFVAYMLSVMLCLLFLVVSLVGYVRWLWLFQNIFYQFLFDLNLQLRLPRTENDATTQMKLKAPWTHLLRLPNYQSRHLAKERKVMMVL